MLKHWLNVEEVAPILGETPDAVYYAIRQRQFPFEFVRIGRRIKISARSIGLISTDRDSSEPLFKEIETLEKQLAESMQNTTNSIANANEAMSKLAEAHSKINELEAKLLWWRETKSNKE